MSKTYEDPVIEKLEGPARHETVERHPAYAMIGVSRVTSTPGQFLFGSDFRHQAFMHIRIYPAEVERGLSNDWYHAGIRPYIEVALSEAQWATFVSSPNVGSGVPCTLEYFDGKQVPGIARKVDRREQFAGEMAQTVARSQQALADLRAAIESHPTLNQKAKKGMCSLIDTASASVGRSAEFVKTQFDEHMETVVEKAKIEANAYLMQAITRAGLAALRDDSPVPELEPGPADYEAACMGPSPSEEEQAKTAAEETRAREDARMPDHILDRDTE